ncbi:MAG TPA: hypothetical protein VGF95_06565 [Solirubrobacteraceae bacterium]|jgi:hypothetical protein
MSEGNRKVTLQINVAPTDLPHALATLPHQLRVWAEQADEVIFSFDLHRTARGGQFGEGFQERREPMEALLAQLCMEHRHARVVPVDYGAQSAAEVADAFTAGVPIPAKDTKGAPIYPYFHGLHSAAGELVLHLDSDMMFGGGSTTWLAEAQGLLTAHPDVLACSPLPGPPRADGELSTQTTERFPPYYPAFRFDSLGTRLFLIDRERLRERLLPLTLSKPIRLVSRAKARLHGNPPYGAAEHAISEAMRSTGMSRVDFLGAAPGMWSLHPPLRSRAFYDALPQLIARIERGDVPQAQHGDYELNDSMFPWGAARLRARLKRLWA